MTKNFASIDVGTHTARLLIAQPVGRPDIIRPLFRKRTYIRLGEGFDRSGRKTIQSDAITRTIKALQAFSLDIEGFNVCQVIAVATGVVREASNRELFLGSIRENTGIAVRPLGGDEEAVLTAKGVLHAIGVPEGPFVIFDLGGGSIEFLFCTGGTQVIMSIAIGAVTLTEGYLNWDPPQEEEISLLSEHIDRSLAVPPVADSGKSDSWPDDFILVGTGGTVTTLAAMLHGIPAKDITPETINGLTLEGPKILRLFDRIKRLSLEERIKLPGLDARRAGVILAGTLVVIRVLHLLRTSQMAVSLSDLLEGILINYFEGEKDE
jgi:exopolyphosphatase/guanosine-5'-triphosphate,3'-diphosphate pyrophosphatase